jgi:hypothetical protein
MLTGILIGALLVVCGYLIYDKFNPKVQEPKEIEETMTEEEIEKDKEEKDHFSNMMNFNAEKAYMGGK